MVTLVVKGNAKAKLDALARKLGTGGALKVGFLAGADYPDGTSVAMVAAIQNFGAPSRGIPPRPFFSGMIAKHQNEWAPALGKILAATQNDVPRALALLGEHMVGQLQQSITDTNAPPLSPVTIARKGFAKPLIDTAVMYRSTAYEVNA